MRGSARRHVPPPPQRSSRKAGPAPYTTTCPLIFSILAASCAVRGIELDLPPAHSRQALAGRVVEIRLLSDGSFLCEGVPVARADIRAKLKASCGTGHASASSCSRPRLTHRWRHWSLLWMRYGCRTGKSCSSPRLTPKRQAIHAGKGMLHHRNRRIAIRAFCAVDRTETSRAGVLLHYRRSNGYGLSGSSDKPGVGELELIIAPEKGKLDAVRLGGTAVISASGTLHW